MYKKFKKEAVKKITECSYSVAEFADRIGFSTNTFYQWCSDLSGSPKDMKSIDDQAELARLKSELIRVME